MNQTNFTIADVDRVTRILDTSPVWVDASKLDTRALAVDLLEQMTIDGHAPSTISPLSFRTTYGLDAYLKLIELHVLDEEPEAVGDIAETPDGLAILTPHGWWEITDDQALNLVAGLGMMLRQRLTRRTDLDAYGDRAAEKRQLKRPLDQTTELSAIADTYA